MQTPLSLRPPKRISRMKIYRTWLDRCAQQGFHVMAILPMLLLLAMLGLLIYRSYPLIETNSLWSLLTGRTWAPSKGEFGFLPFIMGSAWVTGTAIVLAIPPSLLTALYLAEYARPSVRSIMKPILDLLAAIPSVVYGVWGIIAIVPLVSKFTTVPNKFLGEIPFFSSNNTTGYGILAGGFVLAVMVCPFIIAVSFEVLRTVPDGYRHASLAVGATHWETIKYAVLPKARPGLIAGVVLGASRAIGETMAVLMVVGNVAKLPSSIFDAAYPLPALIANNYGEMLSIPLYDAALMTAGLILLLVIIIINVVATLILRRLTKEFSP
jgi:phosphate transport system permease protein